MENRVIFHIDMDAFFASIEILRNPSLKGKPVIVGGRPDTRGVVSTCSYEARAFGVRSAMPLSKAYKLCPHGIFLNGSYRLYCEYSEQVMEIFHDFTPIVQVISIDEAYLDVSEEIKNYENAHAAAQILKKKVFDQTKLPCSIGIASNKLVAKVASGLAKPNGIKQIPPGTESEFLAPFPIQTLPGIGEKTQEVLNNHDIQFVKDLQILGLDPLMQRYGERGYYYFLAAHGRDSRPVNCDDSVRKSIGAEHTFETDQCEYPVLIEALNELMKKAWNRLKRNNMHTRSITLKIRDGTFHTITRSRILFADTANFDILLEETIKLFNNNYTSGIPLRLIGVSFHKLSDQYWQPTLWDWENGQSK